MSSAAPELRAASGALGVRPCRDADEPAWEEFVARCDAATFFHRYGWRRVIAAAFGHTPHYLLAERDGNVCGILPLFHLRSVLFGRALVAVPFCVYGGVAASDPEAATALTERALTLARELRVDYLELRNREPRNPQWPGKDLYVTFRKSIGADHDENLRAVPRKQRAMIRRGIKAGLATRLDADVGSLYDMYAESVRNLGTPVFARRYFALLRDEFGDDCEILVVTDQDRPIAGVLSFYFRDEVLPYYGGGTAAARQVSGNDFMYWQVMCRAAERGVRIFDYGRSKVGTGSYRFKKHWGFEPQPLHYEYGLVRATEVPDVSPANPRYQLMIRLWKKLPLPVTRVVGPLLARNLG